MKLKPLDLSSIYGKKDPSDPIKKIEYKGTIVERLDGEEVNRVKQGLEGLTTLKRDGYLDRFIDVFYDSIDPSTLVGFTVTSLNGNEYYLVAKSKETSQGTPYELVLKGALLTEGPSAEPYLTSSLNLTRQEIQLGICLGTNYTGYQLQTPIEPNPPGWITWAPQFVQDWFRPDLTFDQLLPLHAEKYGASFSLGKSGPLSQLRVEDPKCSLIGNRLHTQVQYSSQ